MPMPQLCGAGCEGQLRYGGSSRPSNILFPKLGYSSSTHMHNYGRGGGGSAAAGGGTSIDATFREGGAAEPSHTSTRNSFSGGCGAFSASMAQLASSAQCSSRARPLHSMGWTSSVNVNGSSSSSHKLCSSFSSAANTLYGSGSFVHGPYGCIAAASTAAAASGSHVRGTSAPVHSASCGILGSGGWGAGVGGAVAGGGGSGLYCSSNCCILSAGGSSSRRGSNCSNVLPPQSHSHQIAKLLEQQQLEIEEAAAAAGGAGAAGAHLSQAHYQYHDGGSRYHSSSDTCYHLIPEKLHDWVEVIKHPRSHGTQSTRIAVSSLHIGECPGVPENASSFALKRTGTLKWQPGSFAEEEDDSSSACCESSNNNCSSSSSKNSTRDSNKNGRVSKGSKSAEGNSSGGYSTVGFSRKAQHYLCHEPKIQLTAPVAGSSLAAAGGGGTAAAAEGRKASGGTALAAAEVTRVSARSASTPGVSGAVQEAAKSAALLCYAADAVSAETEKTGDKRTRDVVALSELFVTAAAAARRPAASKAAAAGREGDGNGAPGETRKKGVCEAEAESGGKKNNANTDCGQPKNKRTLVFRKNSSAPELRKSPGSARTQRYECTAVLNRREVKRKGWTGGRGRVLAAAATAEDTCCSSIADADGATTATSNNHSSGSSGGESDNPAAPIRFPSPPSYGSTLCSLSGRESECSGSPRRHVRLTQRTRVSVRR